MKKSLLALAVLGAFAGAAQAQSNVTLYGIIDVGFVRESGNVVPGAPSGNNKITSGVESGSRIGLRGVEDLGGGLKAKFVAETGFCADSTAGGGFCTGGGTFMGRQAYVGLEGGWGSFTMGRQYNPYFLLLTGTDPFGTGLAGNIGNLVYTAGVRSNNALIYSTPNMSGFTGSLMYAPGEVVGDSSQGRQFEIGLNYANGPITVGLAHHNQKATGVPTGSVKATAIGGGYDFGMVKPVAYYSTIKADNGAGTDTVDARQWMVGATAPIGPGTLMVSYVRHNNKLIDNADANQIAVGYDYNLSKRTNVYVAYGRISNDDLTAFTVGNATEAGSGDKALNLGLRHKF